LSAFATGSGVGLSPWRSTVEHPVPHEARSALPDDFDGANLDQQLWTAVQIVEAISEKFVRVEYIDREVVALCGAEAVNALPAQILV
jgi:hypothetical protein